VLSNYDYFCGQMAKNKPKNKKKKSGSTGPNGGASTTLTAKAYFESGRVSKLPLDQIYYGKEFLQNEEVHTVIFTRRHINNNISFAVFCIHDQLGYNFVANAMFNTPIELLENKLYTIKPARAEQIPSLLKLLADSMVATETFKAMPKDEYPFASLILPSEEESTNWKAEPQKLATFQGAKIPNIFPD